jgi:hypothetical protein
MSGISSEITVSGPFIGDGVTDEFTFDFYVQSANDLSVLVDGAIVTAYSVSFNSSNLGGAVTFDSAPAVDSIIVIALDFESFQATVFANAGFSSAQASALQSFGDRIYQTHLQLKRGVPRLPLSALQNDGFSAEIDLDGADLDAFVGYVIGISTTGFALLSQIANTSVSAALTTVVTASTTDAAVGALNATLEVATKAALSALTAGVVDAVIMRARTTAGDGGGGVFVWRSGDQSANVTADPQAGMWVAPNSDTDGSSGAWQRLVDGDWQAAWWGVSNSATAAANGAALDAATDYANSVGGGPWIVLPDAPEGDPIEISAQLDLSDKHNVKIRGAGGATNGQYGTTLKWTGGSSAMILCDSATGNTTGLQIADIVLDGNSLATRCLDLRGHTGGNFARLVCTGATSDQIHEDVNTGDDTVQLNVWDDIDVQASSTANGWTWGAGTATNNINHNNYQRIRISHTDGIGWKAGNSDSNLIFGLMVQRPSGSGNGIELQAGAGALQNCRANWWFRVQSTGAILSKNGTVDAADNFFSIIAESGSAVPTAEAGAIASLYETEDGLRIFANEGLYLRDTDGSHNLIVKPGSNLTANRTLTVTTGDADRTLTLDGNNSFPSLIATTSFTSPGIDDNATAERIQIADSDLTYGASGVGYVLKNATADQSVRFAGGNAFNDGANFALYGGSHASKATDIEVYAGSTVWFQYDHSATTLNVTGVSIVVGAATGGAKGAGTINATAVYDDNTQLTCYPLAAAVAREAGEVDPAKLVDLTFWDGKAPDRVHAGSPAHQVQATRRARKVVRSIERRDGRAVQIESEVEFDEPVFDELPLFDDAGAPLMEQIATGEKDEAGDPILVERQKVARIPVLVEVSATPDRIEPRIHEGARKFQARLGTEHDPLTLDGYAKHWREKGHLTALPNEAKLDPVKGLATGEWIQRLIETVETQAVLIETLNQRLKALGG